MENILALSGSDFLGLIILGFLIFLVKRNKFIWQIRSSLFAGVLHVTILVICLELATNVMTYFASPSLIPFEYVVNVAGFSLMYILPVLVGMLYSDKVYQNKFRLLIPAFLGILICLTTCYSRWIFWFDANGVYQRGDFFWLNIFIEGFGYGVLTYAQYEIGTRYGKHEQRYLWIVFAIMLGTSLAQVLNQNLQIMWGGVAVGEFLYYVFLRELQFRFDPVTQVRNRIVFVEDLDNTVPTPQLFLVSFDVNNLKKVNDTHGHAAGDRLLLHAARIITSTFYGYGNLYRVGGDEFVLIVPDGTEKELSEAKTKLKYLCDNDKDFSGTDFYIACGYCLFDETKHLDIEKCIIESDELMYEDKRKSKGYAGAERRS